MPRSQLQELRLVVVAGRVAFERSVSSTTTVSSLTIEMTRERQIPLGFEAQEFRRDGRLLPIYANDRPLVEIGVRDGDVLLLTPARKPTSAELSIRAYDRHLRRARKQWLKRVAFTKQCNANSERRAS